MFKQKKPDDSGVAIFLGVVAAAVIFALYDSLVAEYPVLSAGSYQFITMLGCGYIFLKLLKPREKSEHNKEKKQSYTGE